MQMECGSWLTVNKGLLNIGQHAIEQHHSRPSSHRSGPHHHVHSISPRTISLNIGHHAEPSTRHHNLSLPKQSQSTRGPSPVPMTSRAGVGNGGQLAPLDASNAAAGGEGPSLLSVSSKRIPNNSGSATAVNANQSSNTPVSSGNANPNTARPPSSGTGKRHHLNKALHAAYELEQVKIQKKIQENKNFAYKLYFKFTHDAIYLSIPYSQFLNAMKEAKSTDLTRGQ
jgi:hypothetical protein